MALILGALAPFTLAQAGSPLQAPPPIDFLPWREEAEDEETIEYRASFSSAATTGIAVNDVVPVVAILPRERTGPVPVAIVLHYWGATDLRLERSMALRLAQRGVASVLIALPYHLQRTPAGARSGELAVQPDVDRLKGMMLQSVLDVRRTVDWIATRPEFEANHIGLMGTSLGSIVSALSFAVEPRISCGCFVLGGADLAGIIWNSSRAVEVRDQLRRRGFTESRLREALLDVEPLRYLRSAPARPAFVIGARYDTVVPPATTQALIDALGGSPSLWIDTGHFGGALVEPGILRAAADFLASSMEGKAWQPPMRLYSPTLRFGALASGDRGLQVAVGLDVWRSNRRADYFAALLATPKGPTGFVGAKLSRGLSIGASIGARRASWGLFWNFVF